MGRATEPIPHSRSPPPVPPSARGYEHGSARTAIKRPQAGPLRAVPHAPSVVAVCAPTTHLLALSAHARRRHRCTSCGGYALAFPATGGERDRQHGVAVRRGRSLCLAGVARPPLYRLPGTAAEPAVVDPVPFVKLLCRWSEARRCAPLPYSPLAWCESLPERCSRVAG